MRFHALLPVRDEADIIGQCLRHMLTWADAIYVFDTGSVDRTWEIVQEYAANESRVLPLKKDPVFFNENLVRGWLFQQARQKMHDGDWFLRVDADEFHHIPPPEFVRTRLRQNETVVWHQYYDFKLLDSEVRNWDAGQEALADRQRPIEDRRRWFSPSIYSEPRLCRYREAMRWPSTVSFPFNAGFVAQERLPIRHYPHRDPVQLDRRCRLRAIMMADSENRAHWTSPESHQWSEREWFRFVTPDDLPELYFWRPGTELPEFHITNHLAKPHKRMAQWFAHTFCLPALDRRRPHWLEDAYPKIIPAAVVEQLARELKE